MIHLSQLRAITAGFWLSGAGAVTGHGLPAARPGTRAGLTSGPALCDVANGLHASLADVGGVGGPVPGGDFLPLDHGLDVDAERLGQDGGRDLCGQREQGGAAALAGADLEGVEPLVFRFVSSAI
jgi:hypothetical protein